MRLIIFVLILFFAFPKEDFARYEFIPKYSDIVLRLPDIKKSFSLLRYFVSSFYNKKQSENMFKNMAGYLKGEYGNSILTAKSLKKIGIDPAKEFIYTYKAGQKKIFTLAFWMIKRSSKTKSIISILKSFIGKNAKKSSGYFAGIKYVKLFSGKNGYGFYLYKWKNRLIITNHYQGMIYSYYSRYGGQRSLASKLEFKKLINMKKRRDTSWIYLTREGGLALFGEAMEYVDFFQEYNPLYLFRDWLISFSLDKPTIKNYSKTLRVSLSFLLSGRVNKYENFFSRVIKSNSKYIKTMDFKNKNIPLQLRVRIKHQILYNKILSDMPYLEKRKYIKSYYGLAKRLKMNLNEILLNNLTGDISLFLFQLENDTNKVADIAFKAFIFKPYLIKLFLKKLEYKKEINLKKVLINKNEVYEIQYSKPLNFFGATTYLLFKNNYVWIARKKKVIKWIANFPEGKKNKVIRKKRWVKMGGLKFTFIPKMLTSILFSNKLKNIRMYSVLKTLEGFKFISIFLKKKNGILNLDLNLEK